MMQKVLSVVTFISLIGLTTAKVTTPCPRAHELYDDSTGMCYLYQPALATFDVAQRTCSDVGYNLITFHSAFQNTYVAQNAPTEFGFDVEQFWMGMTVYNKTSYAWINDSKPFNYVNFARGEPVSDRHCGCVQITDGKWHSDICDNKKPFVCVGPPPSAFSTTASPCVPTRKN